MLALNPENKIAGILAPSFAIRGENDLGIGDTEALKELITWAAQRGLSMVQILPINETGSDSSPYTSSAQWRSIPHDCHLSRDPARPDPQISSASPQNTIWICSGGELSTTGGQVAQAPASLRGIQDLSLAQHGQSKGKGVRGFRKRQRRLAHGLRDAPRPRELARGVRILRPMAQRTPLADRRSSSGSNRSLPQADGTFAISCASMPTCSGSPIRNGAQSASMPRPRALR